MPPEAPGPTPPPAHATLTPAFQHYKAGRLEQAEALLRRLMQKPGFPEDAPLLLAQVLIARQRTEQAAFELERAIRARPDRPEPRLLLAKAWMAVGDHSKGVAILERAAAEVPPSHEVMGSLGIACVHAGRLAEAERWLRRALDLKPDNGTAAIWLAQVLSGTLRVKEAVELLRADIKANPGRGGEQQTLVFLLQYLDEAAPEEVFREHKLAGLLTARRAGGLPPRIEVTPDPERRLTVGYLSPDFRQHSCAYFMEPLLAARDRERYRVVAYSSATSRDAVTKRLRGLVDEWRDVQTLDDEPLAFLIARDRVDIAVDLAGHSSGSRLSALAYRPAPIAMTYLGYPNTTGMPGIDYRIVDAWTDPPGAESLATETLIRLDGCFLCYRPPQESPEIGPPPSASGAPITFGSFNAVDKISPAAAALWGRVLLAVPGSRLLLKGGKLADPVVRERLLAMFAAAGIGPERIELLTWASGIREHLACYGRVDIALDPFPYNGTTTTCEALWMGVPVVTLAGAMHAGRVGVSLLTAVGAADLVAASPDDYVRTAASLAADPARLAGLRRGLRSRMGASPLCDGPGHAKRLEAAYREAWRKWCAARPVGGRPAT